MDGRRRKLQEIRWLLRLDLELFWMGRGDGRRVKRVNHLVCYFFFSLFICYILGIGMEISIRLGGLK